MAITPIPNRYPGFTFAGQYSGTYGVYIQEPAVFDAPERDVEMIAIPGRNGELVLDKGRFHNIEVTYHCALPASSGQADFISGVASFRNMLASKVGYQRLSDDFNTSEYRMGAFVSGLSVNSVNVESGTFDVVFNCKPQRFLTSGETATAVSSGGKVTNPTLFNARPQLQVTGYGSIDMGGSTIIVNNAPIGRVRVMDYQSQAGISITSTFDDQYANNGDQILSLGYFATVQGVVIPNSGTIVSVAPVGNHTNWTQECSTNGSSMSFRVSYKGPASPALTYGTSVTESPLVRFTCTMADSTTKTVYVDPEYKYNGVNTVSIKQQPYLPTGWLEIGQQAVLNQLTLDSTQSSLGSPLYIDLDIGEAYKIENGETASVNNAVSIPTDLPTLPPGDTTFTYDNTITQFKVVPRWWTV